MSNLKALGSDIQVFQDALGKERTVCIVYTGTETPHNTKRPITTHNHIHIKIQVTKKEVSLYCKVTDC